MATNWGALAGGLAKGMQSGERMRLERDRNERDREWHGARMQNADLGLELVRGRVEEQAREKQYRQGREKLIQDFMTDPTMAEGGEGGYTDGGRAPRERSLADLARLHEEVSMYDFRAGKMDQKTFMDFPRRIRLAQDEGLLDAYRYFVENPNDAMGVAKRINATGRMRVAPESLRLEQKKDPITGMTYPVIGTAADDGYKVLLDPLDLAAFSGGAKGFLDFQDKQSKRATDARRATAAEAQAAATARRADAQERRADAYERRADAQVSTAQRREARLSRQGDGGSKLTLPQLNRNMEITAARKRIRGMSADEIRQRISKATATGRENPLFDPQLERAVHLAFTRAYGDDPDFDAGRWGAGSETNTTSIEDRFSADPVLQGKGYRLGKETERGREVYDQSGKLIGHFN